MRLIYKIAVNSYFTSLRAVSPFNKKANEWVKGRTGLINEFSKIKVVEPLIWFHCASLGEFEQGKPVMESFKKRFPDWLLLVTFFSPSGYEVRKDYVLADFVYYLPQESAKNISVFMDAFKPKLAVFVKYEFWYDYMSALGKAHVPLVFISSTFRDNQIFFRPYGKWFLKQIKNVEMFFVQDSISESLLRENGITKVLVSGDTRFDRVSATKNANEDIQFLEKFKSNNKIIIFGSAWEVETGFAVKLAMNLPKGWKMIFAPHEIDENIIAEFRSNISLNSIRITDLKLENANDADVLIVNTIGQLARLYKYSNVAFVGGGFDDGIHNILEPLTFGVPVFFGPKHQKFWEGASSIMEGVGFEVDSYLKFETEFNQLSKSNEILDVLEKKCSQYIVDRAGATEIISKRLNKLGQIISCQIC